jgi:hypothetical protein
MRKIVMVVAMVSVMGLVGCTTGRMALVDLDLRTPEQITAYQVEAAIPYCRTNQPPVVENKSLLTTTWDDIIKVLEVVKGRLRILSIEWAN